VSNAATYSTRLSSSKFQSTSSRLSCLSTGATAITVTELAFADDITLVPNTLAHGACMLNTIAASSREAGLEINLEKTKVLILGALAVAHPIETLSHDGVPIEWVENFLYLGSLILNTTDRCIRRASHQTGGSHTHRMCGSYLCSEPLGFVVPCFPRPHPFLCL
jgi:hypothetical protein